MKAPDRPDKIYIPVVTSELTNLQYIRYDWASTKPTTYSRDHIEYIKKDALLEWAEKKKNDVKKFGQRYNEANYYNSGCHDTIQELIDKLNSM